MISASGAMIGSRSRIGRSSMRQKATTGAAAGDPGAAGAAGAEARERLRVPALAESRHGQQFSGGDDPLATAPMDSNLKHDLPVRLGQSAECPSPGGIYISENTDGRRRSRRFLPRDKQFSP